MPLDERDAPDPPPLPSTHPTQKHRWLDSVRLPAQFYLEVVGCQLLLALAVYSLQRLIPWIAPVGIFCQPLLWFWLLYRLARRVIEARTARGKPRLEATLVFILALVVPALTALFVGMRLVQAMHEVPRSLEPNIGLMAIEKAERQFKRDFGRYTLNTRELGEPFLENLPPHYVFGFATACSVKAGVDQPKAQWWVEDSILLRGKKTEIDATFLNARLAIDCRDPKEGFEAFAVGVGRRGASLDVWVINENRELRNLVDGWPLSKE